MKLHRTLLATAGAFTLASCGMLGGDPVSDGIAAYEARDYRTARVALATAVNDGQVPAGMEEKAQLCIDNCPEFAITMIEE